MAHESQVVGKWRKTNKNSIINSVFIKIFAFRLKKNDKYFWRLKTYSYLCTRKIVLLEYGGIAQLVRA
ncbi:MAG: hypothetical protein IJ140_03105, partial [Prevotella sp.]|nr:hypothetical protein [Prevotella sp.]